MGDPAGNGPEITVKALADASLYDRCRPLVVGDIKAFQQAAGFVGHPEIKFNKCEKVSDALFEAGTIDVLHMDLIEDISRFEIGKVSVEGGNAAFQSVRRVIQMAMAGEIDATVTNALNKEALNKALAFYKGEKSDGHLHFDGHTEIYATYITSSDKSWQERLDAGKVLLSEDFAVDADGNYIYKKDADGNLIPKLDKDGNPVYVRDENGDIVYEKDEDGNFIIATDEEGKSSSASTSESGKKTQNGRFRPRSR